MFSSKNITQGKKASASDYMIPYEPSRVLEDSMTPSSRWVGTCSSSKPCWLMVDLGGTFHITGWEITSIGKVGWDETCNLNTFKLQVNTSTITNPKWRDVPNEQISGNTSDTVVRNIISLNPVETNALRVCITQGNSRSKSHIASILRFAAMGYPYSYNALLSNLTISSGNLSPRFLPGYGGEYNAIVDANVASITVTPTAQDSNATIAVNDKEVLSGSESQSIQLQSGRNTIRVTVTPSSGTTNKLYLITVTRPSISSNANLSNLIISSGTLAPGFTPENLDYTHIVDENVASVTVTPTAEDATAAITVNGQKVVSGTASGAINLSFGKNTLSVKVTAQNGSEKIYSINVTRWRGSNITQGKTASASGFVMPYNPSRAVNGCCEKDSRWLCASSKDSWLRVDLGGYYKVTGWKVISIGQAGWDKTCNLNTFKLQSYNAALASSGWVDVEEPFEGNKDNIVTHTLKKPVVANALRVYITKGDSRPISEFASILEFIAIGYPLSNHVNLLSLALSENASLTPAFNSSITSYISTVPNSVASIAVTPTAEDSETTITVNDYVVKSGTLSQIIDLSVGATVIRVAVKFPDTRVIKTYTLTVTRQAPPSSNANLSNLTISNGTLEPSFFKTATSYTDAVGYDIASITVTPTVEDSTATIKVNGIAAASGSASGLINLNVGTNLINVEVTAQDGTTKKTYTLTVTRARSARLTNLVLDGISFAFEPTTNVYNVKAVNDIKNTFVTLMPEDNTAAITIAVNDLPVSAGQKINLKDGVNTISVTVTAVDGATQTYTVDVIRASSPYLNGITVSGYSGVKYSPTFTSSNLNYSIANRPVKKSSVNITPETAEIMSGFLVMVDNGMGFSQSVTSGSTCTVPVNTSGGTIITITVHSYVGSDEKQYKIEVN